MEEQTIVLTPKEIEEKEFYKSYWKSGNTSIAELRKLDDVANLPQ